MEEGVREAINVNKELQAKLAQMKGPIPGS